MDGKRHTFVYIEQKKEERKEINKRKWCSCKKKENWG